MKTWTAIGDELQQCQSLAIFKQKIQNLVRPPGNSIYGIHDNIGIKYIFQLRVGLSPLKSHKRKHDFLDTPSDRCDCNLAPEDTYHFILECPLYAAQRQELIVSISTILGPGLQFLVNDSATYLHGHSDLNFTNNKELLLSTITFINDTKRFSSEPPPPPPPNFSPLLSIIYS